MFSKYSDDTEMRNDNRIMIYKIDRTSKKCYSRRSWKLKGQQNNLKKFKDKSWNKNSRVLTIRCSVIACRTLERFRLHHCQQWCCQKDRGTGSLCSYLHRSASPTISKKIIGEIKISTALNKSQSHKTEQFLNQFVIFEIEHIKRTNNWMRLKWKQN